MIPQVCLSTLRTLSEQNSTLFVNEPVSSLEHCIICEKILFGAQVVDLHLKVHPRIGQSNVYC